MPAGGPADAAHEIRRFESVVWSLFVLSENTSIPVPCRAACRLAADFAAERLEPGAPQVPTLVELAIEVGGGENAPREELLLARLRRLGWQGPASALKEAPPPLSGAAPRNIVSERLRQEALANILREVERRLANKDVAIPKREELLRRLDELRKGPGEVRTKTERAWQLLDAIERNLHAARPRDGPKA